MTIWNRLANRLANLPPRVRDDERGAVAVQFALLLLPIAILTFGLIDLSRVSVQKRQLQDAVDAATLMAARSTATTDDDLDTIGDSVLSTEMNGLGLPITDTDATFVAGAGNTVVGTVNVVIQPIIANLWSSGNSTVTVTSTVMRSVNKLEVALVLDNTGSMDSYLGAVKKITALKTAAQSLVDVLAAAAGRATETDAVKVAVVPFSMTVNVGPENQAESWLQTKLPTVEYGADVFATPQDRFALLNTMGLKWSGCVESRPDPYDINDDAPNIDKKASLFVPYFAPDEPDSSYYLKLSNGTKKKYTNSVSNDWAKDVLADPNPANTSTVFFDRQGWISKYVKANLRSGADGVDRGPNAGCGLTSILPLTNLRGATDVKIVKDKLEKMVATGNTNVAMGAIWGWHAVSPNLPLADGTPYGAKNVSKVIILLTDGDNVMSESNNANDSTYSGYGYVWQKRLKDKNGVALDAGSSATARMEAMDSRQKKVCEAAKLKGVQIYSIGVGVSAHSKTVLLACASKPDMYYDVTDAAQLTSVFNTIAGSIQNLRITK